MSDQPVLKIQNVEYPFGDRLYVGEKLRRGQGLISIDHRIQLILQIDNNLAIHAPYSAKPWETSTTTAAVDSMELTEKGLGLKDDKGEVVWSSGTTDNTWKPGQEDHIVLQNDGNLVLNTPKGLVWDSKSGHYKPEAADIPKFTIENFEYPRMFTKGAWDVKDIDKQGECSINFNSTDGAVSVNGPAAFPDEVTFVFDKATLRTLGESTALSGPIPRISFTNSDGREVKTHALETATVSNNVPLKLNNDGSKGHDFHMYAKESDNSFKFILQNVKTEFHTGFYGKVAVVYSDGSKQDVEISGNSSGMIWSMRYQIQRQKDGKWVPF